MSQEVTLSMVADIAMLKADLATTKGDVHDLKSGLARVQWLLVSNLAGIIVLLVAIVVTGKVA